MVNSSALKDLVAFLDDCFGAEATSAEFLADLSACISGYVQVSEKGEQHESRKLLEELKEVVTRNSSTANSKLPLLLKCLKELQEVLEPRDIVDIFEDVILQPILNPYGQSRRTLSDAKDVLLFCLTLQDSPERERQLLPIHFRLFDLYIRKSKDVLHGIAPMHSLQAIKFTITTLEKVLLDFGDKCPKEFLVTIDQYYLSKENRLVISGLMCRFCSAHEHHLYKVLDTNLFDHILQCLEIDTSNAVVTMSLTALVMLLPNVCNMISKQLPQLFFVLYRMLCWKKPSKPSENGLPDIAEEPVWPLGHRRESWEAADASEDSIRTTPPKADQLFTFLYGLFPVNLLKFLTTPTDYLETYHIFLSSENQELFKSEAETILTRHTFNPDILKYTIETEINNTAKWMELEPCEIAAKCSSLDSSNKVFSIKPDRRAEPPSGPLPKPPTNSALSKSLNSEAQQTNAFPTSGDILSVQPSSWMPRSRITNGLASSFNEDMTYSIFSPSGAARLGRNSTYVTNGTETVGFNTGDGEQEPAKPREFASDVPFNARLSLAPSEGSNQEERKHSQDNTDTPEAISQLELELKLLQAQLEFEGLLKRRYLQQIARLQRKKILQSTSDAEREHYIVEIAELKRQIGELTDDLHKQQQSSSLFRQQRAHIEESLYQKVKNIGDDRNYYKAEASRLRLESERYQDENARLRANQKSLDSELLNSRKGSVETLDQESSSSRVEQLKSELQEWKDKVSSQRELEAQKTKLEAAYKRLEMKLAVSEEQNRTLSRRLTQVMSDPGAGAKLSPPNQPRLRSYLDSVAKNHHEEIKQLKETHDILLSQYRSLEDTYRKVLLQKEAERREFQSKQRTGVPLVQDQLPRLLDDGLGGLDPRLGKMTWESTSNDSSVCSELSPTTESGMLPAIPMVNNYAPQIRPSASTSPVEHDIFSSVLPRRASNTGFRKIKTNSDIRIYGRGGAQNLGMKPKKKDKNDVLGGNGHLYILGVSGKGVKGLIIGDGS